MKSADCFNITKNLISVRFTLLYDAVRNMTPRASPLLFAGDPLTVDGMRLRHDVVCSDTPPIMAEMAEFFRGPQHPAMSNHVR